MLVRRYRKHLPHILPDGATYFVTFRLNGSIPLSKLKQLKNKYDTLLSQIPGSQKEKILNLTARYESEKEDIIEQIRSGPMYLSIPEIAELLKFQIHKFENQYYELICYCIMPNHVHLLIDTSVQLGNSQVVLPLFNILKFIKGPTAIASNKILNKTGQFWMTESYDRYIRDDKELFNTYAYILNNPLKANLATDWRDWPYSYSNPKFT
jgi:REP element-mobilizing transposase RayT